MTIRRMWIGNSVVLVGLLVVIVLAVVGEGCTGTVPYEELDPFYDDRVATIRIVMTEEDWSACLTYAFVTKIMFRPISGLMMN